MNVLGEQPHFLDHLLFVVKLGKALLELAIELAKRKERLFFGGGTCRLPFGIFGVHFLVQLAHLLDQKAQSFQMVLSVPRFAVQNDAVEALFGRIGDQFSARAMCSLAAMPEL